MCNPGGVAIDASGNLFVADSGNNRVIEIDAPLAGTQNASRVFGQAGDFTRRNAIAERFCRAYRRCARRRD